MPTPEENLQEALYDIFTDGLQYTDSEAAKVFVSTAIADAIDVFVTEATTAPPDPLFIVEEDFIVPNGTLLHFLASSANGGNSVNVSAVPFLLIKDLNTTTTKPRLGIHQVSVNTQANAFASFFETSSLNSRRYVLLAKGKFFIDYEWQAFAEPSIDFANHPVLAAVGLFNVIATSNVNPTTAIYFRLPRVGESAWVKYVIRTGGSENILNTTIPYTSDFTGFVKTAKLWDGAADTMTFFATDGVNNWSIAVNNFLLDNPTLSGTNFHSGVYVACNGTPTSPAASTGIRLDKYSRWIESNYDKFEI